MNFFGGGGGGDCLLHFFFRVIALCKLGHRKLIIDISKTVTASSLRLA